MTPSPEMMEQIKMAQRSQMKLAQGFNMFTFFVAQGIRPEEAITQMEGAMDVWGAYQDANTIEMPQGGNPLDAMMGKFSEAMTMMAERSAKRQNGEDLPEDRFCTPEELCQEEQLAWDEYLNAKHSLETLHESMSPEATAALEEEAWRLERVWRSFGTAHLRLRLEQLEPTSAAPANSANPQIQDGLKS